MSHFDFLELRAPDERAAEQFAELRRVVTFALDHAPAMLDHLGGVDATALIDRRALAKLPVLRSGDLAEMQAAAPPFGGLASRAPYHTARLFMGPGGLFAPGGDGRDWWRMGRFLHAAGFGMGDIVLNCHSHHLSPDGQMMESGIAAISAASIPAGPDALDRAIEAALGCGATAYAGAPETLSSLLDRAAALGRPLRLVKAAMTGGTLTHTLRAAFADHGVRCFQALATPEIGLIAYESEAGEGMIVDEGVIVEILSPGGVEPVPVGEAGELVVTALNPDYPLLRFATGLIGAVLPGQSPCGRTNLRLRWPLDEAVHGARDADQTPQRRSA